jgi:DNA-directed RNA polymerase specialized sigma24 family protein
VTISKNEGTGPDEINPAASLGHKETNMRIEATQDEWEEVFDRLQSIARGVHRTFANSSLSTGDATAEAFLRLEKAKLTKEQWLLSMSRAVVSVFLDNVRRSASRRRNETNHGTKYDLGSVVSAVAPSTAQLAELVAELEGFESGAIACSEANKERRAKMVTVYWSAMAGYSFTEIAEEQQLTGKQQANRMFEYVVRHLQQRGFAVKMKKAEP